MKRSHTAKRKALVQPPERPIDFDELPTYTGYQVRRTQAKIFLEFEATLKGFDFTPGSFGVLTLIRANPGITQVALAAAVRLVTNEARMRCSVSVAWSASLLTATKRMLGRPTTSQIAAASCASVLLRLT